MMPRPTSTMHNRPPRILLPILLSFAFHIAMVGGLLWGYSAELANFLQPRPAHAVVHDAIYIPEPPRADRMGEMLGKGLAVNSSPGELPSMSRLANQEQADLSRDPPGEGHIGDPPSHQLMPASKVRILDQTEPSRLFGLPVDSTQTQSPVRVQPLPKMPVTSHVANPTPAADPLPESDSESDAFSDVGSVLVQSGRVDARFGRKVKTTRPRISLAGSLDLMSLDNPTVVMKVKTDTTGKVTSVSILRSSGSVDLDHPTELAMYDWWIEPPKDKSGHPLPDVMVWKIAFR